MPSLRQNDSFRRSIGESYNGEISKLPEELLSRIFELGTPNEGLRRRAQIQDFVRYWRGIKDLACGPDCLDDSGHERDEEVEVGHSMSPAGFFPLDPFRTRVCLVCRHWRNVAIATPSLWTIIKVSSNPKSPYEHVSTLLRRSGALPIDILIDFDDRDDDDDDDSVLHIDDQRLYSLLVPHLYRWRSIHLRFSPMQDIHIFFHAVSNASDSAVPHLKSLVLVSPRSTVDSDRFSNASAYTLFRGAVPCLEYVKLVGGLFNWEQPWLTTSRTLTSLNLAHHLDPARPSWGQFATILRNLPQLRTLELISSGPSGEPPTWIDTCIIHVNTPIHLPYLEHLTVARLGLPRAMKLFDRLSMPALKWLTLNFKGTNYTDLVRHIANSVTPATEMGIEHPRNVFSGLKRLDILGLPCDLDGIMTLCSQLVELRMLHVALEGLRGWTLINVLCLSCSPGMRSYWLPRLEILSVSGTSTFCPLIQDFVKKRREAGFPIGSLIIEANNVDNEKLKWFKSNVKSFTAGKVHYRPD